MKQTKVCSKCKKEKTLDNFSKDSRKKDGLRYECKECDNKRRKKNYNENKERQLATNKTYYNKNRDKILKQKRKYYEDNRENKLQYQAKWRKNNRDRRNANEANRRALKHALPYSTSSELWLDIIMDYNGRCAITGKDRFDLEHMIPLSWGWGGSLKDNIYPMESSLNYQKSNKNPFKFMKQLKGKQRANFEQVLRNLAKENGLTYEEYKRFVYWCEKHQRTLEEVIEDNKLGLTQVELWKLRRNYDGSN